MLTAYFDESGINESDANVIFGGYLARNENWLTFDAEWVARLAQSGLDHFHMSPFKADRRPFCPPILNRAAHQSLEHDLGVIIEQAGLHAIVVMIDRAAWDELIVGYRRELWGTALSRAFFDSVNWSQSRAIDLFGEGSELSLVYGESHLGPQLADVISFYNEVRQFAEENPLQGISFRPMRSTPGIQAADMMAWEVQDYFKSYNKPGRGQKLSRTFGRIVKGGSFIQWTRDDIEGFRASTWISLEDG